MADRTRGVVWVPQPVNKFDYHPASVFGELVIIVNRKPHPTIKNSDAPSMVSMVRKKLENFTDSDVVLPIGDPALIAMVTGEVILITGGLLNILKWDNKNHKYYEVTVDLRN